MKNFILASVLTVSFGFASVLPVVRADDEVSPETKALLSKLHDDLKSKTPKVRAAAYTAIGELGVKAKGERRKLCEGLLDPSVVVQTAAADALKKVDEPLSKVALGLVINKDGEQITWAKTNAKDAGPLTPLLLALATNLAPTAVNDKSAGAREEAQKKLRATVAAMVAVDPDDPDVNKAVISMLGNPVGDLRADAVGHLPALKNKKLAVAATLGIAVNTKEGGGIRVAALKVLPDLTDENTNAAVVKAVEAIRFDQDARVRDAVSEALKKLQK